MTEQDVDAGKREEARLDYEDHRQEVFERLKIQSSLADAGLKSLMLVNAGAIVGLFTFIGNSKAHVAINAHLLWWAFGWFVGGIAATLAAHISAFLAQGFYYRQTQDQAWNDQAIILGRQPTRNANRHYHRGFVFEVVGIGGAVVALACFVVGAIFALNGALLT